MRRKSVLSACVALALSGQGWAADISEIDNSDDSHKSLKVICSVNPEKRSKEEQQKLPPECLQQTNRTLSPWLAFGGTAAITALVVAEVMNNDGHHHHHSTDAVPPDDNVIPPDDGDDDNVIPPDDGGDDNPIPPDDGGDVTPPDDGGDNTPIPPDDGGDITPPVPVEFKNNVTWNQANKTLKIRDATFTYSQNADGTYTLTAADGRTTIVNAWEVDNANNTIQIDGANTAGGIDWRYDDDGELYITKKTVLVADDAADTVVINAHDVVITDQGGNTALNGATAMTITGDNIVINNEGDTVATGEGSVVGVLTGNDITITNIGSITVDGGTAAIVNGKDATINNQGDSTITNGGTSAHITGDNATVDNAGTMTVDGANSTGMLIDGNGATVKQEGDLYVSGGAHGIEVNGDRAKVANKGNIIVTDANSVGVLVNGDNAAFATVGDIDVSNAGTGVSITGNTGTIALAGDMQVGDLATGLNVSGDNNNVTVATEELNITGQQATGVKLTGEGNSLTLSGNITVDKDQTADNAADHFFDTSTGIEISGESNTVTLDGLLTVVADSETAPHNYYTNDGSQESINGLKVSGDDNTVYLKGGIQFIGEQNVMGDAGASVADQHYAPGDASIIDVDGQSSVYLSGDSTISGDFPVAYSDIITLRHGAYLEIEEGATFSTDNVTHYDNYMQDQSHVIDVRTGSQLVNNGDVTIKNQGFVLAEGENSTVTNNGDITLSIYDMDPNSTSAIDESNTVIEARDGASATNTGTITSKVMEQVSVINLSAEQGVIAPYLPTTAVAGLTGMRSTNALIYNDASGSIDMYGFGGVGMHAYHNATAQNAGSITINPLWVDENDTTERRSALPTNQALYFGAGMIATDHSTVINQQDGDITVYNAGAGMIAYGSGNTAINQGTINLEQNDFYDPAQGSNTFVGMAVYDHGVAVNDKTGVININAANGQAFYNDGTGYIVNYGLICTFGNCQTRDEYNDAAVSDVYADGDILSAQGTTATLSSTIIAGTVTNAGKSQNGTIIIASDGELINESTGTINTAITVSGTGILENNGTVNTVDMRSGTFNNDGTLNSTVTMEKNSGAVLNNTGSLSTLQINDGTVNNSGVASARVNIQGDAVFNNLADGEARKGAILYNSAVINNAGTWKLGYQNEGNNNGTLDIDDQSVFNNSGDLILDNTKNAIRFQGNNADATLYNTGEMTLDAAIGDGAIHYDSGASQLINNGTVDAKITVAVSTADATSNKAFFWNQDDGVVNFDHDDASAVKFTHSNYVVQNDGTMNISGNSAVAMEGGKNTQLVNNGTINLGEVGTTDTGMIGMQLDASATADAVIENNGTININASNSFAFSVLGTEGHVVNNGTVVIADGVTGSGLIKQGDSVNVEGKNGNNGNDTEVHYTDYTLPGVPSSTNSTASTSGDMNHLNGYVVGTNADGSTGKLMVNNASMNGVEVNTGFAAGTADTTVTFDNVVEGDNLTDASAITSTSVVWNAQGSTDANGNVDVSMTKNAYTDVATDASVSGVAQALDAGYTNNELYTSLNVSTTAELNSALKQISGSQATTVFREARVLSNRFSMLADAAPQMANGLAFNVVAKGDPRAELGNDTQYDMLALRKTLVLSEHQSMSLEYGIARLDGDGAQKAGDNGVTGGYSQFFGLKHQMTFDNDLSWNNALRYDVHQLDSSRSVAYGDVNKTADSDVKQQYLEFRSEGAKTFEVREGLKLTPYAGVKLRHTLEDGYRERSAGDFNLNMNSGSETAVDSIVGLKLDYAGQNGWSANATLEGGPNLSYTKSQRTASLAGAGSQNFNVDDGQKGGSVNSLASIGVKYSSEESSLHLDAYHWKEDGISDKGVMLNVKKTF